MESLLFAVLAPAAIIVMGAVGHVTWQRRAEPGGAALFAFSLVEAAWLLCDLLALIAPTPGATLRLTQGTFVLSPLLTPAWLAFVLSYTGGGLSRTGRRITQGVTAWCLVYGGFALTNGAHRLVWSTWDTVPDGLFLRPAYTLGPLAWVQTGLAWTVLMVSFGVLIAAYAQADRRSRHLSWWIVAGALVPLLLNVTYLFGVGPLTKDFTPLALAVSSGAFALGLVRYRFLDLRPIARSALVDSLRDGMLVLDPRDRIADLNPTMRRLLHATGAQPPALGSALRDVAPDLAEIADGTREAPFLLARDGDTRYFDVHVSALSGSAGGTHAGRLLVLHDATHRHRERDALSETNDTLRATNRRLQARNEELDAFGHTVAHDLQGSIQGVLGFAEALRDDGPALSHEDHHRLSDTLVRSAQKMGTIVHELLLLASVPEATVVPRPIAMGEVVDEALSRVRQTITRPFHPSSPDRWPTTLGHAPWVEEVWVNYLSNAAKYGGPTVTLGAEVTGSGAARFWVHDDGPGIPHEEQSRLFVPFSRGSTGSVQGHGLGLSIARRIVERLGGTCGVESSASAGTTFWFTLPLAAEQEDAVRYHADAA